MQFLQPRRKIIDIRYKKIAQSTKMIKNYSFFEKRLHWSDFMCTKKAVLQFRRQIFDERPKNYRSRSQNEKWIITLFLNFFFEKKHSYGHVESNFRNLADRISTKRQNIQLKVLKKTSNHFFPKKVSVVNNVFWTHWKQLS